MSIELQVIDWVYVAFCAAPLLYAVWVKRQENNRPKAKAIEKTINYEEPEVETERPTKVNPFNLTL